VKPSEFAKLIGVSKTAVNKAIQVGRLARAVTRDASGRVDIDPEIGRAEWSRNTNELLRRKPLAARPAGDAKHQQPPVAPEFPAPSAPMVEFALDPDAPRLAVVLPLGAFVRGAAAALQEAGREATPEAIRAVLVGVGTAGWFQTALGALQSAVYEPAADVEAMWEASGREAVAEAAGQNGVGKP
jgi:hypothetical protein